MNQKIFLLGAVVVALTSSLYADPMFYLKNKSNGPIKLSLKQYNKILKKISVKKDGEFRLDTLDRKTETELEISFLACRKIEKCEKEENPSIPKKLTVTILASPVENKKVYLKFKYPGENNDSTKILVPQKGRAGFATQNFKYSLRNNIDKTDLVSLKITDDSGK